MTREEVEKYINLTGDKEAWENTSVSRIRGYLDGYEKGLEKLDKIRAEVAEYGSIMVSYAITKDTKTDKGIEKLVSDVLKQAKEQVLDIIDKYKAEGGVEDGECK